MSKFKTALYSVGAFLVTAPAMLAEGTPAAGSPEDAISQIQTSLTDILDALKTPVVALVVAGVAVWAIPRIVGLLKSAFNSGKGR